MVVKQRTSYALAVAMLVTGTAWAGTSVLISSDEIRLRSGKDETRVVRDKKESTADASAGGVDVDVEMTGVAIINGNVYIDGEKLPPGKRTYTSKKTGKSYAIEWGKNGNVSVAEK